MTSSSQPVHPSGARAGAEVIRARNNVHFTGRGERVMMFAHGFGCDQTTWRRVAPAFEADYRVVLFDYVGCGRSDWSAWDPDRYASLRGYAQDVLDIVRAFDLREVIFVGHSVSAMIGLLASIESPDRFSRLIHIGPSPCYVNDAGYTLLGYTGGFERKDIEGLLDLMEELRGLGGVPRARGDEKPGPRRARRGAAVELLCRRPARHPPVRTRHVLLGQPGGPGQGAGALPHPPMQR